MLANFAGRKLVFIFFRAPPQVGDCPRQIPDRAGPAHRLCGVRASAADTDVRKR
jgi:hypothetical protein